MRILVLGASWVYGDGSSDPATMSWPAQMAKKYNIEVVNLGRPGSSNNRNTRIGIEELCRNSNYDKVILALAPASRSEVLNNGKWHQVWPGRTDGSSTGLDKIYTEMWLPWNDLQNTIMLSFYFMHSLKAMNVPLYMEGCTFNVSQYEKELSWIMNYNNDFNFNKLEMPLSQLNIGIADLDRKLKSLKAIHLQNLKIQPNYMLESTDFLKLQKVQNKYGFTKKDFVDQNHPNDAGYLALADYFAGKIGLT
jgi:hypothetical protein